MNECPTKVVQFYVQNCPQFLEKALNRTAFLLLQFLTNDLFLFYLMILYPLRPAWTADYADGADMQSLALLYVVLMFCLGSCSLPILCRDMNGGRFGPGSNIIQYCTIYLLAILALN